MKKLAYQNRSEVFEKVVCDRSGRAFRVRVAVFERGGTLRGRIISCVPVSILSPFSKGGEGRVRGCFLIGNTTTPISYSAPKISRRVASPYFHNFDFLTTIKIRAPSRFIAH